MVKENRYGKRGMPEKYRKNEQKTIAIVTPMGYHSVSYTHLDVYKRQIIVFQG